MRGNESAIVHGGASPRPEERWDRPQRSEERNQQRSNPLLFLFAQAFLSNLFLHPKSHLTQNVTSDAAQYRERPDAVAKSGFWSHPQRLTDGTEEPVPALNVHKIPVDI